MLSERPWKVEAVAGLFAVIMFGLVFAGLISMALAHVGATKSIFGNRFIQFAINTFAFQGIALSAITAFLRFHAVGWGDLFGLRNFRWRTIGIALFVVLVTLPLTLLLAHFCSFVLTKLHIEPVQQEPMQILGLTVSLGQKIIFAIGAIILAPVVEESLFRGILYPMIKQSGHPRAAFYGTSLLFALIHFNAVTFIPLVVLAMGFVLLLEATDTLLAPIIAHSSFNLANFLISENDTSITHWIHEVMRQTNQALPI
jgi:membrane protease YdiL (CAAX protease family)